MSVNMNLRKPEEFIATVTELVDRALNAKRCPKCSQLGHEIYSTLPAGFTGIFNCMNPVCPVATFDPQMKEVEL